MSCIQLHEEKEPFAWSVKDHLKTRVKDEQPVDELRGLAMAPPQAYLGEVEPGR